MGRDLGTARALGAAALVHAVAFGLLVHLDLGPVKARHPVPDAPSEGTITEIELRPFGGAAVRDEEGDAPRVGIEGATAELDRRVAAVKAATPPEANAPPTSTVVEEGAAEGPPSPPTDSPLVVRTPLGLGIGGTNPFLARHALPEGPRRDPNAPPAKEDPNVAAKSILKDAARAREREVGLGPEGPLLDALGKATYASASPVKGRAVFLAIANGAGIVVGIDVISSEGPRGPWAEAAQLALAELRGKKLRMPSDAKGAEMRVEVTSEWKMPSGHDPGTNVDVFHIPVSKGEGKKSTSISVLDPIPKVRSTTLQLAPGVEVPFVTIGVDALAIEGDPADIGAKPRRIVHTRLVDSKVL